MDSEAKRNVSILGRIVHEGQVSSFDHARLLVQLRDVTVADAPAQEVASYVQGDIGSEELIGGRLDFNFVELQLSPRLSYAVRAHIDVDGDGEVSVGDLLSMQSFPVAIQEPIIMMTVSVRQVV